MSILRKVIETISQPQIHLEQTTGFAATVVLVLRGFHDTYNNTEAITVLFNQVNRYGCASHFFSHDMASR